MKRILKIGERFNRWTVIGDGYTSSDGKSFIKCRCDCGVEAYVNKGNLTRGGSRSCGCLRSEEQRARKLSHGDAEHGATRSRLYRIWQGMKSRCKFPSATGYKNYGGRGIAVCDEWLDYLNFKAWALANGYEEHLTLDRHPNKDGNYCPENCRWATHLEQVRNQRSNKVVEIFGEPKIAAVWAEDPRCVVDYDCFIGRLSRGWDALSALTLPKRAGVSLSRR